MVRSRRELQWFSSSPVASTFTAKCRPQARWDRKQRGTSWTRAPRGHGAGRQAGGSEGSCCRKDPSDSGLYSFLVFLCNCKIFLFFSASLVDDIKGTLEMEFPRNPFLLRSHSLVSDRKVGYKTLGKKEYSKDRYSKR